MKATPKPIEAANERGLMCQQLKKLDELAEGSKCWAIEDLIGEADQGEIRDEDVLGAVVVGVARAAGRCELARHGTLTAWAKSLRHDDVIAFRATDFSAERAVDKNHSTGALGKTANCRVAI